MSKIINDEKEKIGDSPIPKPLISSTSDVVLRDVYIERGKAIGFGGFSRVYEITIYPISKSKNINMFSKETIGEQLRKETGITSRNGALKYVTVSTSSGLESLMEMNIMKHIKHPALNRALGIQIDFTGNISFVQNLAIGDASQMIRKTSHKLTPEVLRRWIWNIVCSLAQLHRNGILHGDIKCGNLLLYYLSEFGPKVDQAKKGLCKELSNVGLQLNDFSLSRLITDPEIGTKDLQRHISYTSNHRAIEVWKGQNYTFSADMWALGCTIYELTYGMLLFPEQNTVPKSMEVDANLKAFEVWSNLDITSSSTPTRGSSRAKKYFMAKGSNAKDLVVDDSTLFNMEIKSPPAPSQESPLRPVPGVIVPELPEPGYDIETVKSEYNPFLNSEGFTVREKDETDVLTKEFSQANSRDGRERSCFLSPKVDEYIKGRLQSKSFCGIGSSRPIPISAAKRASEHSYFNPKDGIAHSAPPSGLPHITQRKLNISSEWSSPENALVNDIILGLLDINPRKRYTVWDLINHEYFDPIREDPEYYRMLPPQDQCEFTKIKYPVDGVRQTFMEEVRSHISDEDVVYLATSLYQRSREVNSPIKQPSIKACLVVANKLIYRAPPRSFGIVGSSYLEDEINLCKRLNFKLLPHTNDRTSSETPK